MEGVKELLLYLRYKTTSPVADVKCCISYEYTRKLSAERGMSKSLRTLVQVMGYVMESS